MTDEDSKEVLAAASRLRDTVARYRAAIARREEMAKEYDVLAKACSELFRQVGADQAALLEVARPGTTAAEMHAARVLA